MTVTPNLTYALARERTRELTEQAARARRARPPRWSRLEAIDSEPVRAVATNDLKIGEALR